MRVTYDFYLGEEGNTQVVKEIIIPANQSVVIEIPELDILGKTGESKRIWFSWNEKNRMKPLNTQIDTYPFKNEEKTETQLG